VDGQTRVIMWPRLAYLTRVGCRRRRNDETGCLPVNFQPTAFYGHSIVTSEHYWLRGGATVGRQT